MSSKPITMKIYMYFKPCLYMGIIHECIVHELYADLLFLYGLPATMATKNTQSVIRPYIP